MYHSVLVPLDGSPFAEQALPFALAIRRKTDAEVELVRVHVPHVVPDDNAGRLPTDSDIPLLERRHRAYLENVAGRFGGSSPAGLKCKLVFGPVSDSLIAHAMSSGTDLIVMTTHARGPVSRLWLGSVADDLLRRSPIPILLIRPSASSADLSFEPEFRHILIPLDGSTFAEQVVEHAVALSNRSDTRYTLFRVVDQQRPAAFEPIKSDVIERQRLLDEAHIAAQDYLESVAARLRAVASAVRMRTSVADSAAEAILDQARTSKCDAIALATHGRHGLTRMFLGSVADKVVRGATVPVLLYRAADPTSTIQSPPGAIASRKPRIRSTSAPEVRHA